MQTPRPVMIKFQSTSVKNLTMENAPKLKKAEETRNIILSNDLSKEDRLECKRLLEEKKRLIGEKR